MTASRDAKAFNRRTFLSSALALGAMSAAAPALAQGCDLPPLGNLSTSALLEHTKLYRNWVINANTPGQLHGSPAGRGTNTHWVSLKGIPPIKFLQYESQPRGINLGWTGNAAAQTERGARQFFFVPYAGGTDAIRYGQRLAMGWDRDKPFIRYASRDNGINLTWSTQPSFEWTIVGGGANGTVVRQGDRVSLFNRRHNYPMHYFDRSRAGHIGWPDSNPDFWTKLGTGYIKGDPCPQERALRVLRFLAS